ncbi:MAG: histidine--tRNA ligase [Hyphomicrobiales bacterium]|nr:histidine--tRNA ligase [Hyphomicrobiales bacterium]
MTKNKKQKLKARIPRGFIDRSAADIRATDKMISEIGKVYQKYGFDPVETPMFEFTDCLGKFLPDSDRPNEGVFSLIDDDEQWMSLRYDLTAPLARHVAEQFNEIQMPYRTYRSGWVFRNEKPGPGRFRQFMQMDADSVGAPGVQSDAEMCMMMADTMEALGVPRGDYVVRVNNRKVLDGVMEAIGLGGEENAAQRLDVMRSIDKIDRFGIEGVRDLLGAGREDESGAKTKGLGLDEKSIGNILSYISSGISGASVDSIQAESKVEDDNIYELEDTQYFNSNKLTMNSLRRSEVSDYAEDGIRELDQICDLVTAAGYGTNRIRIDPSVVRGLEYYTGPVYEVELTFKIKNEKGQDVVFGSVGGGGRYDGLVKRFTGQPVPATGFSIGVSRLMTALKNLGKLDSTDILAPVLVTVMDGNEMGNYQKMVQELRNANIRSEMYQGNWKKFGNQLKYANRRNCPIAIIQGEDERTTGEVQIKDLIEGKRLSEEIEDNVTWRESRPAQISVRRDELVDAVLKLLAQQAEDRENKPE